MTEETAERSHKGLQRSISAFEIRVNVCEALEEDSEIDIDRSRIN